MDNDLIALNTHCSRSEDVLNNINCLDILNSNFYLDANQQEELTERCKFIIDYIGDFINRD